MSEGRHERGPQAGRGVSARESENARKCARHTDIVDRNAVARAEFGAVLIKLQSAYRAHAAVVEDDQSRPQSMLDSVDENLRVHHERAVAGEGDCVGWAIGDGGCKERARGVTHIRSADV